MPSDSVAVPEVPPTAPARREPADVTRLCLYLAGNTPQSQRAVQRLQAALALATGARPAVEVIDLSLDPQRLDDDAVVALPALVRIEGSRRRMLVGDLSDPQRLADFLGQRAWPAPGALAADPRGPLPAAPATAAGQATRASLATALASPASAAPPPATPRPHPQAATATPTPTQTDTPGTDPLLHDSALALRALGDGQADAWISRGPQGARLHTTARAESSYRRLIEQSALGLATLAADGTVLYANRQLLQMLGWREGSLSGRHLAELLPPEGAQALREAWRQQPEEGRLDCPLPVPGQPAAWLRLAWSRMDADPEGHRALCATDVQALHQAADTLDRQRGELDALVEARTAALRQALAEAEGAAAAKSAFLASMSHEIRTPLSAILGLLHLVRREPLPPAQAERLGRIAQAGQHLQALIEDILALSRLEAQRVRLHLAPVDPRDLLDQVQALLGESARAKGLALQREPGPADLAPVLGDATRLRQALVNLVGNAVKFTAQGGITLRWRCLHAGPRQALLRFEVDDTGPGLPGGLAARLFQPFEQGDGPADGAGQPGSGLGLAITRQLARLMGGDAGWTPGPGGGSRFWFSAALPWAARSDAEPADDAGPARPDLTASPDPSPDARIHRAEQRLAASCAGRRVLLVEDDATNREVIASLLQLPGLQVETAADGQQALERLARAPTPDLVLMDVHLPQLDGLEATRRLRRLPGLRQLPVLALTASSFAEDLARCMAAGMDEFLPKPTPPELLYDTLWRHLNRTTVSDAPQGVTPPPTAAHTARGDDMA